MSSQVRLDASDLEGSVNPEEKFKATSARGQRNVIDTEKAGYPAMSIGQESSREQLMTAEEVAERLNVTTDWVWDHSSRKTPYLPVIRLGDGTLRYRPNKIEEFINERERLSALRRKRR